MDLCFYFNILTVLLIHEIVFSKCDLKTKSYNHFVKSYVDGFQRKERQAPDPSRMYLPPKIDSVASSGFGEQIDASNDKNGYGEVENVQGTFTTSPTTDFSNYGLSPTTTNDASDTQATLGLFDTITRMSNEPVGSFLGQSNGYNTLSSGGNNFGQLSNKNNDYTSGVDVPGTNNNYGTSLGTKSIPNNNGVTAQPGTADDYGQNELLKTAQNQGPSKYNYNGATADSQINQNPSTIADQYSQQGTVENTAGGYGNIDFGTPKASVQGNNQISGQNAYGQGGNGNIGPNRGQSFSVDNIGYGNTVPNTFGKKYTNGDYSQNGYGNIPNTHFSIEKSIDISNNPASIGSVPNIHLQNNPTSKSISQYNNDIVNGKNGQNEFPNNRGFQAGGHNPELSSYGYGQYSSGSNQGVPATSQTYGQNGFEKPNSNSYSSNSKNLPFTAEPISQLLPINNGFEQSSTNAYNQKPIGINKNQIADTSIIGLQLPGTSYQNSYSQNSPDIQSFNQEQGLSNYENGFNLNPPSQLQGSNNFKQSGSYSIGNEENYGQSSLTYNGFYQNQKDQQLPNSYGPPAGPLQSFINGRNPIQSPTNGSANGEYNNQDRSTTGLNVFDQSSPTTSRVSNNKSQTEFQLSYGNSQSSSSPPLSDGYYQGSSLYVLNGFEQNSQSTPGGRLNNDGPVGSQVLPTTGNSFNQNSPTNSAYHQGAQSSASYGGNVVKPNSVNKGNIATTQLGYSQNGLSTPSTSQESSSSFASNGQGIKPCTSKNGGDVNKDKTSTGSPSDPGYGIRNQKKHSTLVPKGQFQNSNSPDSGNGVQVSSNTNNIGNNYGEPGFNSFSNFAPGNQPNQPINPGINNCDTNIHSNSFNEAVFSPSNTGY
ncbi:probable cyclin-dependent serine/threonine-protein kinase DDB_G0292550 isoform X1 [Aphis gossypii]|uniref:probable cyclin-dependent serine/threonine-protein kinase DDB_G0292550 isoform X1 n=2 Tax=Aphis gossypii TaxID=80765 RepID=UPI00100FFFC2|nr:probable cyclin-dependent serine/threonine-protein kinase DDB_G0292550 isoform X1 [Aphis gossypii]